MSHGGTFAFPPHPSHSLPPFHQETSDYCSRRLRLRLRGGRDPLELSGTRQTEGGGASETGGGLRIDGRAAAERGTRTGNGGREVNGDRFRSNLHTTTPQIACSQPHRVSNLL
mmetsp:Transcript_47834/g.94381  ORF Transcript_47834/g.94381 Transcript_47834/m.94381 type:complete len:113 (+) Transcript_47834:413-751(+)